jgi:GDP-L-fucose synthase
LETSHVLPALIRKIHLAKLLDSNDYAAIRRDVKKYSLGSALDKGLDLNSQDAVNEALKRLGISKGQISLWGSGEPFREFLYVDDLASACLFLMEGHDYRDIGELVNIGSGTDIMIKDLAQMVKEIIHFNGEILWDSSKPDGTPKKLLDISKLLKLGWKPQVTLKDGIGRVYEWYKASLKG